MFPRLIHDDDPLFNTVDIDSSADRAQRALPSIRSLLGTQLDIDLSAGHLPHESSGFSPSPSSPTAILVSESSRNTDLGRAAPKAASSSTLQSHKVHVRPARRATISNPPFHDYHDTTTTAGNAADTTPPTPCTTLPTPPFPLTRSLPATPGSFHDSHSDESSSSRRSTRDSDDLEQESALTQSHNPTSGPGYAQWVLRPSADGLITTVPIVRMNRGRRATDAAPSPYPNTAASSSTVTPSQRAQNTRRHVCPTCGKRFPRPSSLMTHERVHTGLKPFKCLHPECDKMFTVASNMRRHFKKSHAKGSESPSIKGLPSHSTQVDADPDMDMEASEPLSTSPSVPGTTGPTTPTTIPSGLPAPSPGLFTLGFRPSSGRTRSEWTYSPGSGRRYTWLEEHDHRVHGTRPSTGGSDTRRGDQMDEDDD